MIDETAAVTHAGRVDTVTGVAYLRCVIQVKEVTAACRVIERSSALRLLIRDDLAYIF